MIAERLTGRKRYRTQRRWFRQELVVLQVEVHREGYEPSDYMGCGQDVDYTYWRDAQITDITQQEETV